MASNAPSREQIPTVRVKKHWWEILWIDVVLGIFVTVAGGLAVQWINNHYQATSSSQAKPSPVSSPIAVDMVPTNQAAGAPASNKDGRVYTGETIRLICKPGWVPSLSTTNPYQQINLWAENITFYENSMEIGIAVSPWTNYSSDAYLSKAAGAYITDENGFRYDIQKDGGDYPGEDFRAIKPDEIYRFRLIFSRSRPTNKLILHHPQFKPITLLLPWADTSTNATPVPTPSPYQPSTDTVISKPEATVTSSQQPSLGTSLEMLKSTPSPVQQQSAGTSLAMPTPVTNPDRGCKRQLVVLKNGFAMVYTRKESNGDITRFFTSEGYFDIPTDQISKLDCD